MTAFTVPGKGLFQFMRMSYGFSYAEATFQRLIDKVIGFDLEPFAYSYFDDIIIVTETFEEHKRDLKRVLDWIKDAGLTIKCEKSRDEVQCLGVVVNRDGFKPDPEKIKPIVEYLVPKNLRQLRRFLGMASWYRKFLSNFATIAEPLTELTKKDRKYEWSTAQEEAFQKLKALIASAPILHRPVSNAQFVVQTDVSDTGIGAVLY